jgi:hypothetical protein
VFDCNAHCKRRAQLLASADWMTPAPPSQLCVTFKTLYRHHHMFLGDKVISNWEPLPDIPTFHTHSFSCMKHCSFLIIKKIKTFYSRIHTTGLLTNWDLRGQAEIFYSFPTVSSNSLYEFYLFLSLDDTSDRS